VRSTAERLEAAFGAALISIAIVGVALLPLTTAPAVRALAAAVRAERDTGLGRERTVRLAEQVRRFVTDADAPPLPVRVDGRDGFDEQAVSHLVDVREVLRPVRTVTLVLSGVLLLWGILRARTPSGRRAVGAAVRGAGALACGALGLVVCAGVFDFDLLFAQFHGLFFEPGTWVFPPDALLIQVFPLRFWTSAGVAWGAGVLLLAAGAIIAGRRIGFTPGVRRV
jgi:hypothetical protein